MKGSLLSSEIAEPYAQALMSVARERNLSEDFGAVCRSLVDLMAESDDLSNFIGSPVVKDEDKKAVLQQILGEQANPYLTNFLMLLVDKRRISFLEPICQQYLALLRQMTNTVLAEVTAARELSEEQAAAVSQKVKELTGANSVDLQTNIDPDLIGGVIIRVGSQVFDASLRGQLRRISLSLGGSA